MHAGDILADGELGPHYDDNFGNISRSSRLAKFPLTILFLGIRNRCRQFALGSLKWPPPTFRS